MIIATRSITIGIFAFLLAAPVRAAAPAAYHVTLYPAIKMPQHATAIVHGQIVGDGPGLVADSPFTARPVVWTSPDKQEYPPLPKSRMRNFQVTAADGHSFVSTANDTIGGPRDAFLAIWSDFHQPPQMITLPHYSLLRPYDICGRQIVGYAKPTSTASDRPPIQAFVYTGSTFITLDPPAKPPAIIICGVRTTDGTHQYGFIIPPGGKEHPTMWNSSPDRPVDFLPRGKTAGIILHARGSYKVGVVDHHAALWTGGPSTYRDLNPPGSKASIANATDGTVVIGAVGLPPPASRVPARNARNTLQADRPPEHARATAWINGKAIDLHAFLPAQFTDSSALHIDAEGNILGEASDGKTPTVVVWSPGPAGSAAAPVHP
ncbi:MAG TPA: hypothetical protein VHQ47_14555 [Phycisphaerae bacterium]|jgi:hypothetical protein|nr:hypothetical protein [Phycisphaerae bacterium]